MERLTPQQIERRSMEIILSELETAPDPDQAPIILRVIHATADFSFARTLRFTHGVIARMREMLTRGALVVTDTNMALAGINKSAAARLGLRLACHMADEDVAREARARGVTRAEVSMERALAVPGEKILVCGNAPTFLFPLLEAKHITDAAVIGVPVGFVNVTQTKERLWLSGLPAVVAMGRRGGSGVAAAIVNALMYGIEGAR